MLMVIPCVYAVTPTDQNFDAQLVGNKGSNSVTIDGITYSNNDEVAQIQIVNDGDIATGLDFALGYRSSGPNSSTVVGFKTSDGDEFKLNTFAVSTGLGTTNLTIKGYRDNSEVISTTYNLGGTFFGTFDVSANASWEYIDEVRISGSDLDIDIDDIDFSPAVIPAPTITSSTYNAATGALVVTGTNFTATAGLANDVIANKFTLTGEGGSTYTLTDTANVEISTATAFTLTLSATDKAAANLIINKSLTSSTGGTTYNLAGAAGFIADSAATADTTSSINATVTAPTVTSSTYDASTGVLVVTGANLKKLNGATNEIVANKFTLYGEGGSSYTLTDTANVEVTSGISFTLTLSATDKAGANLIMNKDGASSTDISTYNLAAAEDWNAGADAAVNIADVTGNGITASNVAVPTVTSATYNASTGALVVTGTGLLKLNGATNDVVANKFTFTGQGDTTYSLVDTANVEITSGTAFTLTLSTTDKSAVNLLLNKNGSSSVGGTTYNLAAAEDWAAGADAAVAVADLTGNGITASNVVSAPDAPTIGTAVAGDGQASVTFTAPVSNGGSAITTYTATASPDGAFGTCAGPAACIATVSGLTNGTAYTFVVTATNGVGTSVASSASNAVIPKANQTITFSNPGAQNFGTSPTLTATSSAGVGYTVSFSSSTTGVCTITTGGTLTLVAAGSCTIDADQSGDIATNAATTVTQSFTVNAVVPGAPTNLAATAGDTQASVAFVAPVNIGGSAITGYTVTTNPAHVVPVNGASSPLVITGLTNGQAYTFTVTATNTAGAGAASATSNSITPAAAQTITFANPGVQSFGTAPTLTATSDSGLTPTFTSSTTSVCTITSGGALTFVTAGSCTINANQAGDSSHLPASQVTQTFNVAAVVPGAPTVAIATAGDTQASVAFTAPSFSGGATVTGYTVTVSPADVGPVNGAGSPILVAGLTNGVAYNFTVTATNSAGTGSSSAASNAAVPKATQTITFPNPGAQNFGTSPTLTATADSGLTPTFTSSTTGVCAITTGGALTFVTAGNCTINAEQAGNGSYLPATQVSRTFTINPILPGAPTAVTAVAGDSSASVSFTAPISNGGSAITSYAVIASPGGATVNGTASPITFSGLTNGTAYTFTVTATNAAGTSVVSAASNSVTPQPSNSAPTITGSPTLTINQGASYLFTPTAADSPGDTLSFSILNKPVWATFNPTTGTLSGTPSNQDVGMTNGIVISVSDGTLSASLPAFNLSVTNVNDAPVATSSTVTLVEDGSVTITLSAVDADNDPLTYEVVSLPASGTLEQHGTVWLYTPEQDFNGADALSFIAKDAELSSEPATVTINVTPVNDDPQAVDDDYTLTSTANDIYALAVLANDVDVDGDTLTIDGAAADIGSVQITSEGLSFTAPEAYVGPVALRYTISDGNKGRASAKVNVLIEGAESENQPVITLPDDVDVNATGLFTRVKLGFAKAVDRNGLPLPVSLVNQSLFFAPGSYFAYWQAVDSDGNKAIKAQKVTVHPLVSLSKDQLVGEGNEVVVSVHLNGAAPVYPLSVPYTVSGSAGSSDHDLVDGVVEVTSGQQAEIRFSTFEDGEVEGDEDVL
ncbi:beta strand repeat-containing protein, partial [Shewanella baltica]|uniref:beta strand repeat-containing protein n=1 Tax=Shewanella baltica TaxID=62322 RepID=UPI003D7B647B